MQWIGMLACLAAFPMLTWGQNFNLSPTFAGHAVALQVNQMGADPLVFADTGPVPPAGGQRENSLRETPPLPGVDALLLYAITLGTGSQNHSQASLNFLDMKLGEHHVTALWVESEATATADFLNVPTSGKCIFDGLAVDGQLVTVTGETNQTITFPDGFLIINEQSGLSNQHIGTLTVNALRLFVDGAGSFTAASSTAEVINSASPNALP
jgi:hypothetical protein